MVVYSGKRRNVDNVYSHDGVWAFDVQTGDVVWVERGHARSMFSGGLLANEALIEKCARCGERINEVRSADFPQLALCNDCFGKWVNVACVTPPGQLLEGYGAAAMATNPQQYVDEHTLESSRGQRLAFFARVLAPKRSKGER